MYERMSVDQWGNNTEGNTEVIGETPVPLSLGPPQIPHGLAWDSNRGSAMRDRQTDA
jgi:hypothetical protein